MKPNFMAIVGAIIAFISLALPWWTIAIDSSPANYGGYYGGPIYSISIYTYQTPFVTIADTIPTHISIPTWYAWIALILVVASGLLGIAGSLIQNARRILATGGLLALFSTIIFATGLQIELSKSLSLLSGISLGTTKVGLFSDGIASTGGIHYTTYLSFGFWLALVAAIIMLAISLRKPEVNMGTT